MRKSLFPVILSMVLLAACGGGRGYDALMHEADSLLTAGEVTSAYTLLAEADSQKTAWSRRQQMAYELLKAQAQNQAYVDFQTDSVMREVARYYDRHGTHNERLKAHYLLGCTYRDLHEAPLAILSWEDAIACADTTAADCDYATLFRVYGQMAEVYFQQFMPEKQLDAENSSCKYALLAGDTLNYIRGLLLRNDAFLALGDTSAIYQNIEHVRNLYLQKGLTKEAAQVYPTAILIALEKQEFEQAGKMIREFEAKSGLFDERGNINPTREIYYYNKGLYYLGINRFDSAEYWFRKEMGVPGFALKAFHGLMSLYKIRGEIDSTFKYSNLYDKALVDYMKQVKTTAIAQAEGMYDYHRHERMAQEQKEEAHRRGTIIILLIFIGTIGIIYIQHKRKTQEAELHQTTLSYFQAKGEIEKLNEEITILKKHQPQQDELDALLKDKEKRILELENKLEIYKEKLGREIPQNDQEGLMNSEIVQHFKELCHLRHYKEKGILHTIQPRAFKDREWEDLLVAVKKYHYSFYYHISVEKKLPKLQFKVCIFSRLGFMTNEMATLIGTSEQNVSNARSRAVKCLFNSNDTSLLDTHLSQM